MRVTAYRQMSAGALVGLATVEMPSGMILQGCPIYERGGRRWAKPPCSRRPGPDGQTIYEDLITFVDRDTTDRWSGAVLAALDLYTQGVR